MYIASLRFYKQMYNKYVINNRFYSETVKSQACFSFFFSPLIAVSLVSLFLTKGTRRKGWTPPRCVARSPSSPSSPCPLSGDWRCLCCGPWSSCAPSLGTRRSKRRWVREGQDYETKCWHKGQKSKCCFVLAIFCYSARGWCNW